MTIAQLADAVRAGDIATVRAMLEARPELANIDMAANNEHRALHYAVLNRAPEMVRVLMEHGADARKGIYPHRDATSALAIATDRSYEDIVAIIEEEERRREARRGSVPAAPEEIDGPLTRAVKQDRHDLLLQLLDAGLDPDERTRVQDLEDVEYSWGMPLWHCAGSGKLAMAEMLLQRGADPNGQVYASGSPVFQAYGQRDWTMVDLLRRYGGVPSASTAGLYRLKELATQMLAGEVDAELGDVTFAGSTVADQLLWGAACGADPEIVRMTLEHIDWPRDDPRWFRILEQPTRVWSHGVGYENESPGDRDPYVVTFGIVLERCDPNVPGRFGLTMLHDIAASRAHVTADQRLAFARLLLDAGARLDMRDDLLKSTPLGWACRWGRIELVTLLLDRGADSIEAAAEPWATPLAWAQKRGHDEVIALLKDR